MDDRSAPSEPLPDLSAAPRTRLRTSWGSVLYLDTASGELRHGAPDAGPANVAFVADPAAAQGRGWLVCERDGRLEPIVCGVEGSWIAPAAGPPGARGPTRLELIRHRPDAIRLRAGGLYLCAEPHGKVTLSRRVAGLWEEFTPLDRWRALPFIADQSPPAPAAGSRFTRRRVLVVRHRGNLANKLLQYMGALTIASRIEGCEIVGVQVPEWGIDIPDDTQDQLFLDNIDLWAWDPFRPHLQELAELGNRSGSLRIMMADHLQRMEFLLNRPSYEHLFPRRPPAGYQPTADDLVINIRSAEILAGVPHYPLLPTAFFEDLIARTGLNPVFVGQLQPSDYLRQLRDRFPNALYIDSRGAAADFELIRSAANIVVAVSTFSWLAAWLSEAKTIFLPLNGFYNPAQHPEIDLLPVDDIRYRFFLFPLNYGMPERESLLHHERMKGRWKEISRNQVALLKSSAPFLRVPRETSYSGLPSRSARASLIAFDPVWYAHEYLDAAMEISEGWFEDPLHHYLDVGRLRGYLPTRPLPGERPIDLSLPNLALHRPATQSSLSQWSRGAGLEEDAARAVNGRPWEEFGFHTDEEPNPWWMVDLGGIAQVSFLRIFNMGGLEAVQQQASPLVAEVTTDGERWRELFRTAPGQIFGGYSAGRPLVWGAPEPVPARFLRLSIPRHGVLHLAQVEIYGHPA